MRVKGKFFFVFQISMKQKYTLTQLGVAGSLLPETIRDAPHNREVKSTKKFSDCTKYK